MFRLLHHCLIAAFLAASLMLLPFDCAEYDYNPTSLPDYDYNATFEYSFYSNSSTEDLATFFNRIENEELDISHEDPVSTATSPRNKAFRTVYPSLLLTPILAVYQLLRLS
ncbi:uncharacterized protein Hap1MRO34_004736 [Clarias gariepinus]